METENNTPYAVEALPQQGPDGKTALTVIVKGTFDMRSGEAAQVSPEQIPVGFGDEPYDTEDGGSVKFESDAAPFKPRADIALVGRAYAPGGRTVNEVDVSLRVGHLKKRLRVIGGRRWKCLGRLLPVTMTRARPFKDMPIVYERAFGGIDTIGGGFCRENLVGRGFVTKKKKRSSTARCCRTSKIPKT